MKQPSLKHLVLLTALTLLAPGAEGATSFTYNYTSFTDPTAESFSKCLFDGVAGDCSSAYFTAYLTFDHLLPPGYREENTGFAGLLDWGFSFHLVGRLTYTFQAADGLFFPNFLLTDSLGNISQWTLSGIGTAPDGRSGTGFVELVHTYIQNYDRVGIVPYSEAIRVLPLQAPLGVWTSPTEASSSPQGIADAPEPSTLSLLGASLLGLGCIVRKRRGALSWS